MVQGATREIFWQVANPRPFYVLTIITLLWIGWRVFRAVRFVRRGPPSRVQPHRTLGGLATFAEIFLHRPLAGGSALSPLWHLLIFHGFLLLFLVTCYLMVAHYVRESLFEGMPYLLVTLVADLAGAALLAGILVALFTLRKDASPARDRSLGKAAALLLLGAVCLTGFLLEGVRIHAQGDPWRAWSPVGAAASRLFSSSSGPLEAARVFKGLWWLHAVLALALLGWIPLSSRFRHMLFLPFQRARLPVHPRSPAPVPDMRALRAASPSPGSVRLGIETASDTTARQRLGLLACMDCGRCERLCPAFQTGQPLTPRKALQDLREYVLKSEQGRWRARARGRSLPCAGEAITADSLWACRLCRACEELCPAGIDHVPQMIELRRSEVMDRGRLPEDGAAALRNLARTGNPYGAGPAERASWVRGLRLPGSSPAGTGGKPLFLWTGCFQPGDDHKPRVYSCLAELLERAGVPFVTAEETACCGDPARIMGEEDLFQGLAREQIRRIEASGAERVLAHCPHCYTVLKDIYPLLGARFSAIHTSELFQKRIAEGKLGCRGFPTPRSVVYHDPCFLSRYQGLDGPPRAVLESLPGLVPVEPPRARRQGFCCGAGGGHYFMDLDLQERPSSQRLEEMIALGADTVAVSCGFCFSMFDDARRRRADSPPLRVVDWVELLQEAMESE
jgi:Fe-S oxidoreductase